MEKRNLNNNKVRILKDGKEITMKLDEFLAPYNAVSVVRLRPMEFSYAKTQDQWVHWNLHPAHHKVGDRYLAIRIIRPGMFMDKTEILPLLASDDAFVVECVEYQSPLKIEELNEKLLKGTYPWALTPNGISQYIAEKYGETLSIKSKDDLIGAPLSRNLLRKVKA